MEIKLIEEFLQNRPVDPVQIRSAVQKILKENQSLKRALLTGAENKHRYSGQITEKLHDEVVCACGETVIFKQERKLPWDTIKSVLSLVQNTSKQQK